MEFEVAAAVVDAGSSRRRRGVAAVLIGFGVVVGIAFSSLGPARVGQAPDMPKLTRTVPTDLRCRDVDRGTCQRMARAAIGALPDDAPAVVAATVWRSLLCGDTFDCPPAYLDGSTPLGSVTVRFADGSPQAAINVVDGRSGPIKRAPQAWIVRWLSDSPSRSTLVTGIQRPSEERTNGLLQPKQEPGSRTDGRAGGRSLPVHAGHGTT